MLNIFMNYTPPQIFILLACNIPVKCMYSKTRVKWPLSKRPKIGFQNQLLLNASQKYCRMPQGEHSAILPTFIKLPFVIKIFVLSIFECPFYTGFTVCQAEWKTVWVLIRSFHQKQGSAGQELKCHQIF